MIEVVFDYAHGSDSWQQAIKMETVPRIDEVVEDRNGDAYLVKTVVWYPFGSVNEEKTEPFVCVVLKR